MVPTLNRLIQVRCVLVSSVNVLCLCSKRKAGPLLVRCRWWACPTVWTCDQVSLWGQSSWGHFQCPISLVKHDRQEASIYNDDTSSFLLSSFYFVFNYLMIQTVSYVLISPCWHWSFEQYTSTNLLIFNIQSLLDLYVLDLCLSLTFTLSVIVSGHPNMVHMQRMAHPGSRMPGPMNPTVSEFNVCIQDPFH